MEIFYSILFIILSLFRLESVQFFFYQMVGRALAIRMGGYELNSQPSHTKALKNGDRYTHLSAKLEGDINKQGRWLSSRWMLRERFSCPNEELNAVRTSYARPLLITIHPEN